METTPVEIDGVASEYIRQGAGQPLILVHGTASDALTWEKHVETLSSSFDVIAPSLRYFGSAPWPDNGSEFGTTRHATDLLKLIDLLEVKEVICAGWSYGGNVALHAGLLKPDAFSSLFLYEPAAASLLKDKVNREKATADRADMFARTAQRLKTEKPEAVVETFLDDAAGRTGAFKSMPTYVQKRCIENASMLNLLLTMVPADLSLDDFAIPTTIACGKDTRDFYRITTEGLEQQCESITARWIPEADHLWPAIDLQGFCGELSDFAQAYR